MRANISFVFVPLVWRDMRPSVPLARFTAAYMHLVLLPVFTANHLLCDVERWREHAAVWQQLGNKTKEGVHAVPAHTVSSAPQKEEKQSIQH